MIDILGKKYMTEKEASSVYPYSAKWFQKKRKDSRSGKTDGPPFIQLSYRGKSYYPVIALENWFKKRIAENE